jgi:hypothetical protein
MLVQLLALSLSQGVAAQPTRLDQMAQPAIEQPAQTKVQVVMLDCQVAAQALTDCKAINDAGSQAAAEAIRMAADIHTPDAIADGVRIRIKMNVAP